MQGLDEVKVEGGGAQSLSRSSSATISMTEAQRCMSLFFALCTKVESALEGYKTSLCVTSRMATFCNSFPMSARCDFARCRAGDLIFWLWSSLKYMIANKRLCFFPLQKHSLLRQLFTFYGNSSKAVKQVSSMRESFIHVFV